MDLKSHVVLSGGVELMVEDEPELLELAVHLHALGLIPRNGVGVRRQAWGRGVSQQNIAWVPCQTEEDI